MTSFLNRCRIIIISFIIKSLSNHYSIIIRTPLDHNHIIINHHHIIITLLSHHHQILIKSLLSCHSSISPEQFRSLQKPVCRLREHPMRTTQAPKLYHRLMLCPMQNLVIATNVPWQCHKHLSYRYDYASHKPQDYSADVTLFDHYSIIASNPPNLQSSKHPIIQIGTAECA